MEKCPHCNKTYAKYPLWDYSTGKKKPIIENWIMPDWKDALMILFIFTILYGFFVTTEGCENAIKDPYQFCKDAGVMMPFYSAIEGQNLTRMNAWQSFGQFQVYKKIALIGMITTALIVLYKVILLTIRLKKRGVFD